MDHSFGPWATQMDVRGNHRLGAFWRRRMTRLPAVYRSTVRWTWPARAFLVAAAVVIGGLPTLRDKPAVAEPPAAPPPYRIAPALSVEPAVIHLVARGKVMDLAGEPIAGARVCLREWSSKRLAEDPFDRHPNDVLVAVQADQQGEFALQADLTVPDGPWGGYCPWDIVATVQGRALGWRHLSFPKEEMTRLLRAPRHLRTVDKEVALTVTLRPEATITGRIVSEAGKPVPGADVSVIFIDRLGSEHVLGRYDDPERLDLQASRLAPRGKTDRDGNVTLGGLPPDVRLWLLVDHEQYTPAYPLVATTAVPQPDVVPHFDPFEYFGSKQTLQKVFASRFAVTLEPAKSRIVGRVTLADTGQPPRPGARILAVGENPYQCDFGKTDSSGRFVLRRIVWRQYRLSIAPVDSEYLGRELQVGVPPDKREVHVEVKLQRRPAIADRPVIDLWSTGITPNPKTLPAPQPAPATIVWPADPTPNPEALPAPQPIDEATMRAGPIATQVSSNDPRAMERARRLPAEMKEVVAEERYEFAGSFGEGGGFIYEITLSDGSRQNVVLPLRLESVTSWDEYLKKYQEQQRQQFEKYNKEQGGWSRSPASATRSKGTSP